MSEGRAGRSRGELVMLMLLMRTRRLRVGRDKSAARRRAIRGRNRFWCSGDDYHDEVVYELKEVDYERMTWVTPTSNAESQDWLVDIKHRR